MDHSCGNCGFAGPIEHKESVVVDRETEEVQNYGEMSWSTIVAVYLCPLCNEPTTWFYVWNDDIGEAFNERRLYPTARDNAPLPERTRRRYEAALKVKKIEPSFYAVGIRRMIETVANEEGATGKDLFEKLDHLAAQGRIPGTLAELAHRLRRLGNLGAHDAEIEIDESDVQSIEDFAEAILEYMYRAPAKLAVLDASLAEREENANP